MSIKDLFDHGTSISSLKSGSLKESFNPVESYRNIQQVMDKQNRFIPPIDFATTSNFAKFGSAELYYDTAIKRIYGNYPYDGTAAEKNKFDNDSLFIDKYIFDFLYPKSTGFAVFSANGFGSRTAISTDGYATPSTIEFIQFRGGPHTSSYGMDGLRTSFSGSNIYDENIYDNEGLPSDFAKGTRTSNLRFTGSDGATVEFWLKKPSFDTTSTTHREIIFDMWNNQTASSHSGSTCYGRMMIELDGQYSTGSSFLVTLMSGTSGFQHRRIGSLAGTSSLADWNHYAFTFLQSGSFLKTKFYLNGNLNEETNSEFVIGGFEHPQLQGRIGALLTSPTGSTAPAAAGKLSASLDEFRYWKAARSSKQISDFYFVPVNGGTNTDIANATLGVYYKFNEGITGTSSTDSTVLDYSGRVSNGNWVGYNSAARNTGSAIVQSSASNSEPLDPIIHANHPEVMVLHENLLQSGTLHDGLNNAMVYHTLPGWIIDEAEREGSEDLRYLSHLLGVYFDKLYLQIESLAAFNNTQYLSASYKAFPFYKNAIEGKGLETPDLFIEANLLEKFAQRTDRTNLTMDLVEIKNLIYQNIHSNLISIYKAKGTEKSIRNVMRTFGIGDDLIKLNLYANNAKYELVDNLQQQLIKKKYVNFSKKGQSNAVVYQTTEPDNSNSFEFISGSKGNKFEKTLGFSLEANVMFPKYFHDQTDDFYDRNWLTSSLFGMFKADHTASSDVTTFAPSGSDFANFQIQFIRNFPRSRSGYFRISSSNSPYPIPLMTSSIFYDVYDDDNWLLSFTLKPNRYQEVSTVSGASHLDVNGYEAIFSGYHKVLGTTVDSFYLTSSLETTASRDFLKSDKRIFAGAHRDNITGTVLYQNDTKMTELRYWAYTLEPEEIERHAVDIENVGVLNPFRIIGNLDPNFEDMEVRKKDSLALHWNFNNVTASDASGEFIVQDASSGSFEIRERLGFFGNYPGYQHTGKGKYFITSSKNAFSQEYINNSKFRHYEQIVSSDMINILDVDDSVFGSNQRPTHYHFTIEKSMYDVISQEMLNMFAGIVDFNNLIGEAVHRYRDSYKNLDKLRAIFFEKVGNTPDIDRYLEFYKWFDDALSLIIRQLVPATADISDDLYNVIEEHALERNKYKTPFPTMEFKEQIPEAFIRGIEELEYSWKFGHSPLPSSKRTQEQKGLYWTSRAEKDDIDLTIRSASLGPFIASSAGAAYDNSFAIDITRKELRDIIYANPHFSQSLPTLANIDGTTYSGHAHAIRTFAKTYKFRVSNPVASTFKGGVNFSPGKSMEKVYNAVAPHGPIEAHGSKGGVGCEGCKLPVNILFARSEDFEPYKDLYDPLPPHAKIKKKMKVVHGRDSNKEALGYSAAKSAFFFPMNVVSGTIDPDQLLGSEKHFIVANNAYERQISGNITNIHNDVYGRQMEKPMQGPFTEYAVGGHQSRHVELNRGVPAGTITGGVGDTSASPSSSAWVLSTQENRPEAWRIYLGRCEDDEYPDMDQGRTAIGIVGPDYPKPDLKLPLTSNLQVSDVYPYTPFPRAAYYRDGTAKRPVNIGNIHHTTGSPTILGNFNKRYEYVQTSGRKAQRRYLKDTVDHNYGDAPGSTEFGSSSVETVYFHTASLLPERLLGPSSEEKFPTPTTASTFFYQTTNVHTLIGGIDAPISPPGGLGNVFGGNQVNALSNRFSINPFGTIFAVPKRKRRDGIFTNRFSAPGGPEVLTPGYLDIHTGEFSVYNSINFRNLSVRSSGSGEAIGYRTNPDVAVTEVLFKSIRMNNVLNTGSDDERLQVRQGLRTLLTRHAGKSYSDSQFGYIPNNLYIDEDHKAPASFHKVFRNNVRQLREIAADIDYGTVSGETVITSKGFHPGLTIKPQTVITGSFFNNYWVQHIIPRSDLNYSWITASVLHDEFVPSTHGVYGYLPAMPPLSDELKRYNYSGFISASAFRVVPDAATPGKSKAEGPHGRGSAYKIPYNFISASEYVVYEQTGTSIPYRLGADKYKSPHITLNHIPIDFVGLNLIVVEAISSSTAQLGFHLDHNTSSDGRKQHTAEVSFFPQNPPYFNDVLLDKSVIGSSTSKYGVTPTLNMLLLHRQGPYGYPSWKQTRGAEHPIMIFERDRNILREPTVFSDSLTSSFPGLQKRYHIQPITSKYKAVQVDIAHPEYTPADYYLTDLEPFERFYSTNYNQIVGMQSDERDSSFSTNPDASNTWWDSLASALGEEAASVPGTIVGSAEHGEFPYRVFYRETIWPSSLMVYMSSSRGRVGYSDRVWRGIHSDRILLGASRLNATRNNTMTPQARRYSYPTSFVQDGTNFSANGPRLSQSSWPLDAQEDFLTRIGGPGNTGDQGTHGSGGIGNPPRVLHRHQVTAVSGAGNIEVFGGTDAFNQTFGPAGLGGADFVNRREVGFITGGYHNGEGELQNSYTMFHGNISILSGGVHRGGTFLSQPGRALVPVFPVILQINPTALYARKQTLSSYRSVVGPYGIDVPETASNRAVALAFSSSLSGGHHPTHDFGAGGGGDDSAGTADIDLDGADSSKVGVGGGIAAAISARSKGGGTMRTCFGNIDLFGGEAVWQAPELAGYISRSIHPTDGVIPFFVTASSEPWYEKYEDYILDLRAVGKEYSIVPEFNSKRWIPLSLTGGISLAGPFVSEIGGGTPWYHNIEIITGGTTGSFNAALDNNPEDLLFKVTRGDNLRDLIGIQENLNAENMLDAEMTISRLKLTMDAIIKFVPYEGFYPVQRSLQLVEEFWKSHGNFVRTSFTPIEGQPPGVDLSPAAPEQFAVGGIEMNDYYEHPSVSGLGRKVYHPITGAGTTEIKSYQEKSTAWNAHLGPGLYGLNSGSEAGWTYFTGSDSLLNGKHTSRPLAQTLFSPGILYNTIKSGIAVDYPIMLSESFERVCLANFFEDSDTFEPTDYWAVSGPSGSMRKDTTDITFGRFDFRVPFEAIINPAQVGGHLAHKTIVDMEPHPSAALQYTNAELGSFDGHSLYSQKTSNFFAGVANFYLDNNSYTSTQGELVDLVPVTSGSVYGMRLKMYRSMAKDRDYSGNPLPANRKFPTGGGLPGKPGRLIGWAKLGATSSKTNEAYEIPQDPHASGTFPGYVHWQYNTIGTKFQGGYPGDQGQKETFTMYSRPTAFGPPLLGRWTAPYVRDSDDEKIKGQIQMRTLGAFGEGMQFPWMMEGSGCMDSINGYNWAFTPPYYHGEAWVDIVYKPTASTGVSIQQIFDDPRTYVHYWRADPGPTGSIEHRGGARAPTHTIIPDPMFVSSSITDSGQFYAGNNINFNAMQMSASFNIFNIEFEKPHKFTVNAAGDLIPLPTFTMGRSQSWVIQSKFETPMLNFNDQHSIRPLHAPKSNAERNNDQKYLDIPIYASESVPRGMWHQFGVLPTDDNQGIFMSVEDIPPSWLKSHPFVVESEPTIYNRDYHGGRRPNYHLEFKSLANLCRIPKGPTRLGEMPLQKTVREAVVAVPYYLDEDGITKRFFDLNIDRQQVKEYRIKRHYAPDLAINQIAFKIPSPAGRKLSDRGSGLLTLFDQMERYVFPPKLDFIRYPGMVLDGDPLLGLGARVMYVFEFEHVFDQDDLSYMWQNLAPRNYKSFTKVRKEISHNLLSRAGDPLFGNGHEFLSKEDFLEYSDRIRWIVFKVKERGAQSYADILKGERHFREGDPGVFPSTFSVFGHPTVDGEVVPELPPDFNDPLSEFPETARVVEHNWPYDYFSLVETAKLTVDVEFRPTTTLPPYKPAASATDAEGFSPAGGSEFWEPSLNYEIPLPPEGTGIPPADTTGPDVPEAPVITDGTTGVGPGVITGTSIILEDPFE